MKWPLTTRRAWNVCGLYRMNGWKTVRVSGRNARRRIAKFASRPETMKIVLQHVDAEYGGVQVYLENVGVSSADVERLRGRLIENPDRVRP